MKRGRYWWAPDINTTRGVTLSMAIGYGLVSLGWLGLAVIGGGTFRWLLALGFGAFTYLAVAHLLVNRPPKSSTRTFDRTGGGA